MISKLKKMKINTLFEIVKNKRSIETEVFIQQNNIDVNVKNDTLNTSILTAINIGMSKDKTHYTSKENALYFINLIDDPFYLNGRNTVDILETYILNHFSCLKPNHTDFLIEELIRKISEKYKDRKEDFENDIINTIKAIIDNDIYDPKNYQQANNETVIQKSIYNYLNKNVNLKKNLKELIQYEKDNLIDSIDNSEGLSQNNFMILQTSKKLLDIIFLYADKYNNNKLIEVCLNIIGWKNINDNFSAYFFKPLMILSAFPMNQRKEQSEHISYIFENLDYEKYPLVLNEDIDEYFKIINERDPALFALINKYIINGIHTAKKAQQMNKPVENNNLKRTRI